MNDDMLRLITSSNHVSTGKFIGSSWKISATRGKALSLLQKTSKKRTP